jgi:hypothetical protein
VFGQPRANGAQHRTGTWIPEPIPVIHISTVHGHAKLSEFSMVGHDEEILSLELRRHTGGDGSLDRSYRAVMHVDRFHNSSIRC